VPRMMAAAIPIRNVLPEIFICYLINDTSLWFAGQPAVARLAS
jgi:hypothetical protein